MSRVDRWFVWILAFGLVGCTVSEKAPSLGPPRVTLSVFEGQSTSDPGIEEMINAVVAQQVPDVTLRWEVMGWGDAFEAQIRAKFAAGEVPDLMIGKAQDVAAYVPSGNLAPLASELTALVTPLARASVTEGGAVYGLPYNAFYQGVLYNKDLFRREGLSVPQTLGQMKTLVERLRSRGLVPFAAHFLENWYVGNIFMQFALGEALGTNPSWGRQFRAGMTSFGTSGPMARCFDQVHLIYDHTWADAANIDLTEADRRFAQGKAAMYLTGSWTLQTLSALQGHLELGIFPFPNATGDARLIFEPNITFMKSAHTAHSDAVDRVLRAVYTNGDLAGQIVEFTKTSSMLSAGVPAEPLAIQADIDRYRTQGRVVDASNGNNQLIWSFQAEVATRLMDWLQGKTSLAVIEEWCDRNRSLSGS